MIAAQYTENSEDHSVVNLTNVEVPTATEGMVVVRVNSAAINPIDLMVMKGVMKSVGWAMPLPFVMGYDFAGVVDTVHSFVAGFSPGDRVFAVNWGDHSHADADLPVGGAFAEYICVPASKLSKIPEGVTYDQAAAVALVGTTAHQILFDCCKVTADSKILILGGSTAVGNLAIQLAKSKGAWVAATCSSRNVDFVTQAGADLVLNYQEKKWEDIAELKNLDAVLDCVGEKEGWSRTSKNGVVKSDGAFVSISNPDVGFDPKGHAPMHFASFYCLKNSVAVQDELASMIAAGTLKVPIDGIFPFTAEGMKEIMKKMDSGSSTGKNVMHIEEVK
mmetsp:Transcript_114047/g.223697  ORF Transcript_114047/g.223697 Transcript_114047/m.223697 type:complete len:333 (-) Transcript_114047:80-1078(-)|eukprot:CAMPEP_0170411062 /NCGR_PEP_ID=MMETSP0117_2-20130122/30225_1 /TAXON_ID=400756 /ORGANISM="Durinskia baltica, Strain CSIRO CS-38" /LENGTH=332 /DNA_ID=CAMNT_0010668641 /DNA_START=46 /DNA_END=1044 /DNA_ORIENTATION=+